LSDLDSAALALARSTVERAAPEEMPIFAAASEAYLEGGDSGRGGSDDVLGFGVEAAVILLTPIAIEVAKDVLGYLKEQVTELASKKGREGVDALIARLGGGGKEPKDGDDEPELSKEELELVRTRAIQKAKQLKLSDDRATLLADSLVGSLATA